MEAARSRPRIGRIAVRFVLVSIDEYGRWLTALAALPAVALILAALGFHVPSVRLPLSLPQWVSGLASAAITWAGLLAIFPFFAYGLARATYEETRLSLLGSHGRIVHDMSIEEDRDTFQAQDMPLESRGVRLGLACTNVNHFRRSLVALQCHLADLKRWDGTNWIAVPGFSMARLSWELGGSELNLAPHERRVCEVAVHERRYGIGVHMATNATYFPWVLEDGCYRATVTFRADDYEPITRTVFFESRGNRGPGGSRNLDFVKACDCLRP